MAGRVTEIWTKLTSQQFNSGFRKTNLLSQRDESMEIEWIKSGSSYCHFLKTLFKFKLMHYFMNILHLFNYFNTEKIKKHPKNS